MIWYLLVGVNFMLLAVLTSRFQSSAPQATQQLRLNRKAAIMMLLVTSGLFYPLLIAYFHLYPISSPRHFTTTLLLWFISLNGVVLTLFSSRLVEYLPLPFTKGMLGKWLLLLGSSAIGAGILMHREMASGSLLSAWTPLFCLLGSLCCYSFWYLILQIPAQIRLRQQTAR
ncbi:MAG: hypothetical protein ACRCRW_14780 [Aeromonadaceae bacterium]